MESINQTSIQTTRFTFDKYSPDEEDWNYYRQRFLVELRVHCIRKDDTKPDLLLSKVGPEAFKILVDYCRPTDGAAGGGAAMSAAMAALGNFTLDLPPPLVENVTGQSPVVQLPPSRMTSSVLCIITAVYMFGLLGNSIAFYYLFSPKSKPRNPRHVLLLTFLLVNDLTAVLGMWTQMNVQVNFPELARNKTFCQIRVIWRAFGLGSGCIVCVMAIERWFALTRPFYYTKHVTVSCLRKGTIILWLINLTVVCMPFFGFGAYYDDNLSACIRYKNATLPKDVAYAYVYMAFGACLCSTVLMSNVGVILSLTGKKRSSSRQPVLVRRHSRNKDLASSSTAEESAFARVMVYISISFVASWLPQIVSVPVAQMIDPAYGKKYFRIADIVLATHFIINPYFYVLQKAIIFKPSKWCRKPSSRTSSVKTSNDMCSL